LIPKNPPRKAVKMSVSSYATIAASTAPNPIPVPRVVYEPEKDTFKQTLYSNVMLNIFDKMRPAQSDYMYHMLRTIYTDSPLRFKIASGIHQNHEKDPLHFSVEVNLEGIKMTFHVNGYYKSPKFIVTDLSILHNQTTVKIASFNNTMKTPQDYPQIE
jgi:hypothetical protein